MNPIAKIVILLAALGACPFVCSGQQNASGTDSASALAPARIATPLKFKHETFTFVRIQYSGPAAGTPRLRSGRSTAWMTDYPDADVNFTARFQKETGLKCDDEGKVMTLNDPELRRFSFIYIVEAGSLRLTDAEVASLRSYLTGGGFLMIDDFWGDDEWENVATEMKRVFPERKISDVPRTDKIFHCFFDIRNDLNLQVPSIAWAMAGRASGVTWEENKRYDTDTNAHTRGIRDEKGRLCVVFCHNTDLGDGWEREGENEYFFQEFSLKKAYPLGINIVVYALTR